MSSLSLVNAKNHFSLFYLATRVLIGQFSCPTHHEYRMKEFSHYRLGLRTFAMQDVSGELGGKARTGRKAIGSPKAASAPTGKECVT